MSYSYFSIPFTGNIFRFGFGDSKNDYAVEVYLSDKSGHRVLGVRDLSTRGEDVGIVECDVCNRFGPTTISFAMEDSMYAWITVIDDRENEERHFFAIDWSFPHSYEDEMKGAAPDDET